MDQRICSVDECERGVYSRGVCNMHYQRWRNGSQVAVGATVEWPKVCAAPECDGKVHARGLCNKHLKRLVKFGELEPTFPPPAPRPKRVGVEPCTIDSCEKVQVARGWCTAHWTRWKRHGSPVHQVRGEIVNGRRICPHCRAAVLVEDWYIRPDGTYLACRECFGEWNRQRAHARRVGPDGERFTRREILNRDMWVCQLCDAPIDPTLGHPDPMSATLDHIVPISRGGLHTRANAQAAHRICNMRKWAHVPD